MIDSMSLLKKTLAEKSKQESAGESTLRAVMDPAYDDKATHIKPISEALGDSLFSEDSILDDDEFGDAEMYDRLMNFEGAEEKVKPTAVEEPVIIPPVVQAQPKYVELDMDGNEISDLASLSQELEEEDKLGSVFGGNKKVPLIIGISVIGVLVLFIVMYFIGQTAKEKETVTQPNKPTLSPTQQQANNLHPTAIRTNNQSFKFSETVYEDSLQISKCIELEHTVVHCYFNGKLAAYKKQVLFEVSADVYNKYVEGDILSITFNITEFGGEQYLTNIKVKEE